MAASINDKFTEATNGSRPVPTTLTALLPSGASPGTATCGALTGWATATAVHFVIYTVDVNGRKVSGSQTDWKGVVSGSTITGLVLKAGTNNGYAIGAVVEAAPTAAWADDVTEGIRVEHNQDGTHSAITATSLVASGNSTAASHISTGDAQLRSVSLETIHSHWVFDHIQTGMVWTGDSYGSTRAASMTAGFVYINGRRSASVTAVSARTFTASKDTYVDVAVDGTITYTEVNNNAASPALTANNIRVAIVVTAAGSIAAAGSINQGDPFSVLPIASSQPYAVTDSLGNLICPRDPHRKLLGMATIVANQTPMTSETDFTGGNVPVIVPTGRKIRLSACIFPVSSVTGDEIACSIKEGATQFQQFDYPVQAASHNGTINGEVTIMPTAGSHTYKITLQRLSGTGTVSNGAAATRPTIFKVELV